MRVIFLQIIIWPGDSRGAAGQLSVAVWNSVQSQDRHGHANAAGLLPRREHAAGDTQHVLPSTRCLNVSSVHRRRFRQHHWPGNWRSIRHLLCNSNVLQRDNVVFARGLDKSLASVAKEEAKEVWTLANIWLGCCMRAYSMYKVSSNLPSLEARPGLMWCAIGLRFWYVGDTDPASKLAIGIGHLWSWARFMAT